MACPQGSRRAVDLGSFRCDPELSALLAARGVWETLRARLAQAEDLEGFVAELTDVLEKVRARRASGGTTGRPMVGRTFVFTSAWPVTITMLPTDIMYALDHVHCTPLADAAYEGGTLVRLNTARKMKMDAFLAGYPPPPAILIQK